LIEVEHLTRRFHDLVAVDDVSLSVAAGEVFGFLGPNGAGKSTTIRILTGFLPATSGRAVVAGHDVASDGLAVRERVGYLPENVPLPLDARVDEYLEYRGRLKGLDRTRRAERRERVLEQCGLVPMRRRILGQLSKGYRQRVGLADALLADPPLLILDEPTGGLDPGQRREVLDLITRLRGDRTVLLSSHVLAEIEDVATRVGIIKDGRLVGVGTREELEESVGRRGEVRVQLADGRAEALARALREDGEEVERTDTDSVWLSGVEEARLPDLLAGLVAAGYRVRRFEPLARSLEAVFLDLTRTSRG